MLNIHHKLNASSCAMLALVTAYTFSTEIQASEFTLQNHTGDKTNNTVLINPSTLTIDWNGLSANSATLTVDGIPQTVAEITTESTRAFWTLMPSRIAVKAELNKGELDLQFTLPSDIKVKRNQPIELAWFDLAEQETQTLLLPFSEGMRVPTDNKLWARYLTNNHSGSNTTQDLKMPFWTTQQSDQFISYQLINPTNNQLFFNDVTSESDSKNKSLIDMSASHQFTALNQSQPFAVRITLGNSMLDGAKHYRDWRIENGLSEPLASKQTRNPDINKLVGASHVYLFGKDPLSIQDVKDWWGLKEWYFERSKLNISDEAKRELLPLSKGKDWLSQYHKQLLLDSISQSLKSLYPVASPTLADNTIEAQYIAAQSRKKWLFEHASSFLNSPDTWGQALSSGMVDNLNNAGLNKLWLGFDNWMPAFYQPNAVELAKQSGYLVGTYDSYNTAIPAQLNDSWLTAQLPDPIRKTCAIEQADGALKKGFRGNGFYLNPNCHLDYVKQRVKDIMKFGHFNSLFLDVDATAMAREDYSDNTSELQMLSDFNNRMHWLSEQPLSRHNFS